MRVALIHEWLTNRAGSEKVVASLRDAFPGASLSTTMRWRPAFPDWDPVQTTVLQRFATGPSAHIKALAAMPPAWRALRLPEADAYVTSFHTFALHARVPVQTPHVVYCHTPPRFIYSSAQLRDEGGTMRRLAIGAASRSLASADLRRARRTSRFVANSTCVRDRIRAAYGHDAEVVHPPVDVERFRAAVGTPKGDYFLFLSRLVPYKRPDLAIAAFGRLGWPLVVAGGGRAADRLRATAPPNIRFVGHVPDDDLPRLLAGARALVFPGEEDFGITPVEAMAAGTPVVAYGSGGVLDTVEDGASGVLFPRQEVDDLVAAIRRAAATDWEATAVSASTLRFGPERFVEAMRSVVRDVVADV